MSKYLLKIKQELSKRECQDCIKTWALMMAMMLSMSYFWIDWHDYLDDIAVEDYAGIFVEDKEVNLIILVGLLALQWLPLYIMFRITFFLYPIISNKLGWYENFDNYMRSNLTKQKV